MSPSHPPGPAEMTSPNAWVALLRLSKSFHILSFLSLSHSLRWRWRWRVRSDFLLSPAPAQSHSRPPTSSSRPSGATWGEKRRFLPGTRVRGPEDALDTASGATRGKRRRKPRFWAACPAPGPKSPGAELRGTTSATPTPPRTHHQDTHAGRRANLWARVAVHGLTLPSLTKIHPPSPGPPRH